MRVCKLFKESLDWCILCMHLAVRCCGYYDRENVVLQYVLYYATCYTGSEVRNCLDTRVQQLVRFDPFWDTRRWTP